METTQHAVERRPVGRLLGPDDPPPYTVVNDGAGGRTLLVCDHASAVVPSRLGRLGLDPADLGRHIAIDIGAANMTRELSARLDLPAIFAGYSRLVIDNNRGLDDPTSIPEISDGTVVPGNRTLDAAAAAARANEIFHPYHDAIADKLDAMARNQGTPALVAIHSFTPVFRGHERPWHVGLLWNRDQRIARPLFEALAANPGLIVGDNEPYSAQDPYGYTMSTHAEPQGWPHLVIEIRQDLIDTHKGVATWADILAPALERVLGDDLLFGAEVHR